MKEGPNPAQQSYSPAIKHKKFGIVYAQWNAEITHVLRDGATSFLLEQGVAKENVLVKAVSGAFELPLAAQYMEPYVDAVVCIGCLVKGETPHFKYISQTVTQQLSHLSVKHNKPMAFGVLTVNTEEQAFERAGGAFGNKGQEAAEAAYSLLSLAEELRQSDK